MTHKKEEVIEAYDDLSFEIKLPYRFISWKLQASTNEAADIAENQE